MLTEANRPFADRGYPSDKVLEEFEAELNLRFAD